MSSRTVELIVSIVGGLAAVVLVRWLLHRAYIEFERRQQDKDPTDVARRRTTWLFAQRVIVALVAAIAVWVVLSQFDVTRTIAQALLASTAVIALLAGLAFNVPLSNLGSGMLVAFAQPLRLGDRVTIGEHTGFVEKMSLLYTTLATDDARRVAIPNSQLTSSVIVNRTIRDPRRAVNVSLSVPIGADLERAIAVLSEATGRVGGLQGAPRVLVGDVGDARVRLDVSAYGPLDADVAGLQSRVREEGLRALNAAGLIAG
jgi:small conductance mechanosensitive channel